MIRRNHQITRHDQLKAAADRVSVDSGNHRFVEMPHLSQPRKAAGQISIGLPPVVQLLLPTIQRLKIPAGGEDLFSGRRDESNAKLRIIAQQNYCLIDSAA